MYYRDHSRHNDVYSKVRRNILLLGGKEKIDNERDSVFRWRCRWFVENNFPHKITWNITKCRTTFSRKIFKLNTTKCRTIPYRITPSSYVPYVAGFPGLFIVIAPSSYVPYVAGFPGLFIVIAPSRRGDPIWTIHINQQHRVHKTKGWS
jgi:hypothetical protein